jgi:hypothetical protein
MAGSFHKLGPVTLPAFAFKNEHMQGWRGVAATKASLEAFATRCRVAPAQTSPTKMVGSK